MLAVVVADGEPAPEDADVVSRADLVIAADGGGRWLEGQGVRPHLVVGDLDSLDATTIESLRGSGTRISRHPPEKDASDTELALEAAVAAGADQIVVLGAVGGSRLDHELANVLLLVDPAFAAIDVRLQRGPTKLRAIDGPASLTIEVGAGGTVTLLPIGADAVGVRTRGLKYGLDDGTLVMGRSRGLSNVVVEEPATVSLLAGSLLVIEIATRKEGES